MSINKTYAVFGLGKFGSAIAKELSNSGADVVAVDKREALVNALSEFVPVCKCADITDAENLKQIGVSNFDVVIITTSSNLEASVMATMLCKEAGVKQIIVKCSNETHRKILEKVGADKIVAPEWESGIRLARNLLSNGFIDVIELSKDVSMVECAVREEWIGKTLKELNLRKKYSINVVAIIKNESVSTFIDPDMPLTRDMELIIIADIEKLEKLK